MRATIYMICVLLRGGTSQYNSKALLCEPAGCLKFRPRGGRVGRSPSLPPYSLKQRKEAPPCGLQARGSRWRQREYCQEKKEERERIIWVTQHFCALRTVQYGMIWVYMENDEEREEGDLPPISCDSQYSIGLSSDRYNVLQVQYSTFCCCTR